MRVPFHKAAFSALSTAAVVLAVSGGAFAQITLTSAANVYTQNFDTLSAANNNVAVTFTNNSTILGLYSNRTQIISSPGNSGTGGLYSFGVAGTNAVTDRSLGSVGSGSADPVLYGFRIANTDAANNITGFTISYRGEQFRTGSVATPETLTFSYQVFSSGAGTIAGGTYINNTTLDFASPNNATTSVAIDGNAPGNFANVTGAVTGISVDSTQELFVRFSDVDSAGADRGLSIDDFSFTAQFAPNAATPEPGTLALFALGAGPATGLVALRRRATRRNKA